MKWIRHSMYYDALSVFLSKNQLFMYKKSLRYPVKKVGCAE